MEMIADECVAQIKRLLECYPGVHVVSAVHHAAHAKTYITLSITSIQSLARLVQNAVVGANVKVDVRASGHRMHYGQPFDESTLTYSIEVPDDDGRGSFADPPAPLHILGIFLARDLKHLGLIAADDADKLQDAWHGVVM